LYLGEPEKADATLAAARAVLFPDKGEPKARRTYAVAYCLLAHAYAATLAQAPPGEAAKGLEELFTRMEPMRDPLTTPHFATLHLSVTEAAALGLAGVE